MEIKQINEIPYPERKGFVKQSCLIFKKVKTTRNKFAALKGYDEYKLLELDPESIFERIMKLLDQDERLIIENDFLDKSERTNWYLDYWSKSSYYKYKHEAINKFIYLLFS